MSVWLNVESDGCFVILRLDNSHFVLVLENINQVGNFQL